MFFVLFVRDQHVPVSGTDYVGSRFWNRNAKGGVAGVCPSLREGWREGGVAKGLVPRGMMCNVA